MTESGFEPQILLLDTGDEVLWNGLEQGCSIEMPSWLSIHGFPKIKSQPGASFTLIFNTPGIYPFYCPEKPSASNTGVLVVGNPTELSVMLEFYVTLAESRKETPHVKTQLLDLKEFLKKEGKFEL